MKLFKEIQIRSAVFLVSYLLIACGDSFVNLTSPTTVSSTDFYKNESDAKLALTGIYGTLRNNYYNYHFLTEAPSDNVISYPESDAATGAFDKLTWNPSTTTFSTTWSGHYQTIAQVNILLNRIETVSFSDAALKARYIAEAKFLRALMYFNLVRYFGDVPLILKEIKTEADAYTYLREPVANVYTQIEKDLADAEAVLPLSYTTSSDIGRATSGAAKSLLGKVLLQQKKYTLAAAKLREVVTPNSPYNLLTNYADVFDPTKNNNAEIVFAVQYTGRTGFGEGSGFCYQFAPASSTTITTGSAGYSFNIGSLDLYNSFEQGDSRKSTIGVYTSGTGAFGTYYYTKKFLDTPPSPNEGNNDWFVIRYPDVLLMLAEALNNDNRTSEALTEIKKVRIRAGLDTDLTLDRNQTQSLIEQERRVELCFEGHRWFDLIRWGKMVPVMTAFKNAYPDVSISMSVVPERALYPIPFIERSLNSKLTQNPGY